MARTPDFNRMIAMESSGMVQSKKSLEGVVIPGLLQTPEYAFAIFKSYPFSTEQEIQRSSAERNNRLSKMLGRTTLHLTMYERALGEDHKVGDAAVMKDAVSRMIDLTAEHPEEQLTVRVIPNGHGPIIAENYVIHEYRGGTHSDVYVSDGKKRLDESDDRAYRQEIFALQAYLEENTSRDETQDLLRQREQFWEFRL